jgi:hypothetical protein
MRLFSRPIQVRLDSNDDEIFAERQSRLNLVLLQADYEFVNSLYLSPFRIGPTWNSCRFHSLFGKPYVAGHLIYGKSCTTSFLYRRNKLSREGISRVVARGC